MNLSIFPQGIDTFVEHYDIQPSDLPYIRRYQELKQKSYLGVEEQNELSNLTHQLREKIFLADDFNKLQDCITNLENFFKNETQGHLDKLKGDLQGVVDKNIQDMNTLKGEYGQLHEANKGELDGIKQDLIQTGENYINTSKHWYTSWVTTANQSEFDITQGTEVIPEDTELDFQEDILDLFLNGDMLLPDRDYTFELAPNGKKQIIKLSVDLSSTLVANQRLIAKWFTNVGKLYIDHSHEHEFGGKDAIVVTKEMLHEDLQLQIGDTTAVDNLKSEVTKLAEGKADKVHKHVKADITDFAHTHKKAEITDFAHTHSKSEITDFPTSLPANGGNADTVGGKSASQFASSSHNHAGVYAPVTHSHADYSLTSHTHTQYAPTAHTHNYAPNNGIASTAEAQAGTNDAKYMTPLKVKQAITALGMTGVDWGRIYTGGSSLSGSTNVDTGILTARTVEGSAVVQSGNELKFTKTGTYLVLLDASQAELKSGGASGINLNYHIGAYNIGAIGLQTAVKYAYGIHAIGKLTVSSTATTYGVMVSASPMYSGQSFSLSFGSIEYFFIKIA